MWLLLGKLHWWFSTQSCKRTP